MENKWTKVIEELSQRCAEMQDELQSTVDMAYKLQEMNFKKTALLFEIYEWLENHDCIFGALSCHFELDDIPEYLKKEWLRLKNEKNMESS